MRAFINNYLETISPLWPLIVLLFCIKKDTSMAIRILFFHYSMATLLCIVIAILSYLYIENIIFYTVFSITQFVTISFFFYFITKDRRQSYIIIGSAFLYMLFLPFNFTFLETNAAFTSISTATAALLIILYCFLYFRERLILVDLDNVETKRNFFIVVSFFLYYAGAFFIFLTYRTITIEGINFSDLSVRRDIGTLWGMHNIIYFISCLISSSGLLWHMFQTKPTS